MRHFLYSALVLVVVLLGCGAERFPATESWEAAESPQLMKTKAPAGAEGPLPSTRKLIQTVSLVLRVDDSAGAAKEVEALTLAAGGYLASTNAYLSAGLRHVELTLRVPAG